MTAQEDHIARVRDDLADDDRVRGLWLTGSHGSGVADALSDVDMFCLVTPQTGGAFLRDWPEHVRETYQPLMVQQVPGAPVFNHVLEGWLRWDLVIGTGTELAELDARRVTELFNKDGARAGSARHRGADPDVVLEMTEEFLRVLGLLPVVVGRGELVSAVSGAALLRQTLITLLRYRAEGDALTGALHLNRVLPADELAALAALPAATAERSSVIEAHLACARLFLPAARAMLRDRYPAHLEHACLTHLEATLGLDSADSAVRVGRRGTSR
ncbi:MAG: hypothetical protein ACXVW2_12210 [Nocardioidaceae bacterium]